MYEDDKKFGDIGEEEILKRIQKKYPDAYIDNIGKANSDWDIWIPSEKFGIEVKMDYRSRGTGNILLEVEMDFKPSALSITKAKQWVFITGYLFIWMTPLEIYRFIERHPTLYREPITGNGDKKPKKAYKAPLHLILKEVIKLDKEVGFIENIKENDRLYFDNLAQEPDCDFLNGDKYKGNIFKLT